MTTSRTGKPIAVVDYDPAWPARFAAERDLIYATCGRDAFVRIEHVGSTAVPALAAKPIVDMMPGIRSLAGAPPILDALATIGYEYVPEFERDGPLGEGMPFRRYCRKDLAGERAFHLHMVEFRSDFWVNHLMFRNYLRVRTELREQYADLKRRLAGDFNANLRPDSDINVGYTDRKTDFVLGVLDRARAHIARNVPIELADYDPEWARRFERERAEIARVAGEFAADIQHVGSTSIPGLAAKPLIDVAFGARDMAGAGAVSERLASIGLARNPNVDLPDWIMFRRFDDGRDAVHVHMVPHGGRRWRNYIGFRDHLRAHRDLVEQYAALKRELADEFGRDYIGYTEAKSGFISEVTAAALAAD